MIILSVKSADLNGEWWIYFNKYIANNIADTYIILYVMIRSRTINDKRL